MRHFWLAVTQRSTLQSSTGRLSPPKIEIASTISKMSLSAHNSPSCCRQRTVTPVEVSLYTKARALALGCSFMARSNCSMRGAFPQSAPTRSEERRVGKDRVLTQPKHHNQ